MPSATNAKNAAKKKKKKGKGNGNNNANSIVNTPSEAVIVNKPTAKEKLLESKKLLEAAKKNTEMALWKVVADCLSGMGKHN